jgi:tetratricopeptide (TPR) repeat protein
MKKILLILMLITINLSISVGQTSEIDSIRVVLFKCKNDTNCVKSNIAISNRFWKVGVFDSALFYANRATMLAKKIKYQVGESNSINTVGVIYMLQGEYQIALDYFLKSLKIKENINDISGVAKSCNNIGLIYSNLGKYPEALTYHFKSLKIKEQLKDEPTIASSLINIGLVYENQNQYKEALEYYNKAIILQLKLNDKFGLAQTYNNIGVVYSNQMKLEEALEYSKKALEIRTELNDLRGMAATFSNIGNIYQNMAVQIDIKDSIKFKEPLFNDALNCFFKSIKLKEQINDKSEVSAVYINIGLIYMYLNNYKLAKQYFNQALVLANEVGEKNIIKYAFESLSKVDSAYFNYKGAYENYKKFIVYKDSLENEEDTKRIIQQQMQYDFDKKTTADSIKTAEHKKVLNARIEKEKTQKYALYGGLTIVVLFLVFVYNRLQVTRKQKGIIEEQKEVVEKAHHELEEKNHEILQSITYAKRLQQSILPPPRLVKEYMKDSFVLYMPKDIVAGDFYWIESHNNKIYFAAADCTGHGVPGAMVSMVCHNALNRALLEFGLLKPAQILDKASELVDETFSKSEDNVQDGMDISLFCLDTQTRELEWTGANNPLWMIQNGEFKEIKADKQPVCKKMI